jgi:RNA polymerase sigma factor (sigma-70 family)
MKEETDTLTAWEAERQYLNALNARLALPGNIVTGKRQQRRVNRESVARREAEATRRCYKESQLAKVAREKTRGHKFYSTVNREEFMESFGACFEVLNERESLILRRRFGMDCEPWTLQKIGTHLGVSRERVRQIQNEAIQKLRSKFVALRMLDSE